MVKKAALWVSGALLIGLFLVWQIVRTSEFYRDWTGNNDLLGLLGVVVSWAFLALGAGIIVKALIPKRKTGEETTE